MLLGRLQPSGWHMTAEGRRDSRGLILRAARQEFGARGYAGGRVDRIARRAGVNKQLIFYYFGSKAGLFQAVIEAASREIAAAAVHGEAAAGGPLEQLRALLERLFGALSANADLLRATTVTSGTESDVPALMTPLARLEQAVRLLVSEAQGLGFVRDDVDPGVVARMVLATAVGSVALDGASPPEVSREEIALLMRALSW